MFFFLVAYSIVSNLSCFAIWGILTLNFKNNNNKIIPERRFASALFSSRKDSPTNICVTALWWTDVYSVLLSRSIHRKWKLSEWQPTMTRKHQVTNNLNYFAIWRKIQLCSKQISADAEVVQWQTHRRASHQTWDEMCADEESHC